MPKITKAPDKTTIATAPRAYPGELRMWPSFEIASKLYDWANVFLIGSLVIGAVSTVLVVWMGNAKEAYLKEGIALANERAETAREHAAQLELRVAEAKKLAGPRNIRGQDKEHLKAALEVFPGTPYDLSFPTITDHGPSPNFLEPGSMLIDHLMVILSNLCGWELRSIEGKIPKVALPLAHRLLTADVRSLTSGRTVSIPDILVGQITGVVGIKVILPGNTKLRAPAQALLTTLNDIGLAADFEWPEPYNNIATDMVTTDAIHIVVGTKP